MKIRQNLYIDREIGDALEALAAGRGGNKSRLVNDALAAWLAAKGLRDVDTLLKPRLDRLSRELGLVRRDVAVILETLSLFVRYELNVTPPLADGDAAGRALGRERFAEFVAMVGRQLASGRPTLGELPVDGDARDR